MRIFLAGFGLAMLILVAIFFSIPRPDCIPMRGGNGCSYTLGTMG